MDQPSKKTLRIFGWASFLNDFGSDMIFPLWPIFLTQHLGASMAVVGLIDGIGDAVVSISQAVSGYLSDKWGKRKVFVWLGYACAGIARIGYRLAPTWQFIIPFRMLDRSGKMRGAPRDAIIADISTHLDRGRNFGYLRMMDNLGAVCGVIFTIFFFKYLGFHNLFLIAAIPSLVGSLLIFKFIQRDPDSMAPQSKVIRFSETSRDLRLYFLLSIIFSLSAFSYSFQLIYAQKFGFSIVAIPVLYLCYTVVASVVSIPFGRLADKIHRKPVLMLSFLFWILACFTFITFQNTVGIIAAFVLTGLHLGALEPVQRALVSELAVREHRASTLGAFQMLTGLAALPASVVAGFLWEKIGMTAPFYFSAGLTLLSMMILLSVREKKYD